MFKRYFVKRASKILKTYITFFERLPNSREYIINNRKYFNKYFNTLIKHLLNI